MSIGATRDDARAAAGAAGRQALEVLARLFWGTGWLLAKALGLALSAVGGFFWSLGWIARRALWPALRWCWSAIRIGWDDGRGKGEREERRR